MKIVLFIILILIIFEIYYKIKIKNKNKLMIYRLNHVKNLYRINKVIISCNSYIQLIKSYNWSKQYLHRYLKLDKNYKHFKKDYELIERWFIEKKFNLEKPTKEEIDTLLEESENRSIFLRKGQWLFNELYKMYPNFINSIRGTEYDPFYDDNRIDKFINYIKQ